MAAGYWCCSSQKKAGKHCPVGGIIPHHKLLEACLDVLELEEFDEEVFLERMDTILVPERYRLEFHLNDGTVVVRDCPATGRQDSWTKERRAEASEQRMRNSVNAKYAACFTGKIRCDKCGRNFRRQTLKRKSGIVVRWFCPTKGQPCGAVRLWEEHLKPMTAEVLGCTEFDESVFEEQIDHIAVVSATELVFHFKDGRQVSREWVKPRKKMPPWTEERRQKMNKHMKETE